MTGLDRWILDAFAKLQKDVATAYDAYEFHVVYQKVSQFASVELSSIYHDVIKDRLYTDPANSHRRRSSQSALHQLVANLCQMLAPILAFTADEAWEFVPGIEEDDFGVQTATGVRSRNDDNGVIHDTTPPPTFCQLQDPDTDICAALHKTQCIGLPTDLCLPHVVRVPPPPRVSSRPQ